MTVTSDGESKEDKGDIVGLSLARLNFGPVKKLLVLKLGGEHCERVFFNDGASFPRGRRADAISGKFQIYKRPYCEEFLKFCFQRFEVEQKCITYPMPWIVCVMGDYKSKLLFIWDQDDCTDSGFKTKENKFKPIFLKELKNHWKSPKCGGNILQRTH